MSTSLWSDATMRWPRSLRNRIFLASSLAAVLPILGAFMYVSDRVSRQAESALARELTEAARELTEQHRSRLETLREMAHLVADLPKLKAAVATGDPPTVEPLARDYMRRLRCDLFVVADPAGRILAALGSRGNAADLMSRPAASWSPEDGALSRRDAAGRAQTFVSAGERVLEVVSVAIVVGPAPVERLGVLTIGFRLDEALAAELKRLTGSEVAFVHRDQVRATTLEHAAHAGLAALPRGTPVPFLDGELLALRQSLLELEPDAPDVVVLRSRAEGLRFLRTLRWALVVAALAALAVAIVLSYEVARTVTRPLSALTAEMRAIAATGDLTRRIPHGSRWDDEDARLLARTFNALAASIARFQNEAAIKDRLTALGRLSTVVAHEVRNPLMIIKTILRSLRRDDLSAEERREAADDVDHEIARLDRIVGDVLDYARPPRVETTPTDLAALCRETCRQLEADLPSLTCALEVDESVGWVRTDPERLRTAVTNVLRNARDSVLAARTAHETLASASADVRVNVRRTSARGVEVVVADSGGGIAPEDLPHLFEPYFTTRRTGTGLGLPIAKKIVEALGGTIDAASAPEGGATLRIRLPSDGPPGAEAMGGRG